MKKAIRKIINYTIVAVISFFVSLFAAVFIHINLSQNSNYTFSLHIGNALRCIYTEQQALELFIIFLALMLLIFATIIHSVNCVKFSNKTIKVTPDIELPAISGNGEYGTAKFMDKRFYQKKFSFVEIDERSELIKNLIEHGYDAPDAELEIFEKPIITKGGVVIGKAKGKSLFYYIATDTHTITIGTTRSGKTRCVSLQSICLQALAGESMINVDPKGELYLYTKYFLKRLGYEVIALDFDNPSKSARVNYLQEVIDLVNKDEIPKAIQVTRDIVAALVATRSHGEPIWTNGERAVLACAMISVIWDNRERPDYQNMANVYYFIAKMCRPDVKGNLPLSAYLHSISSEFHPARLTIDISEISPSKMRGSFYGSALTTLSLYVDPNIYGMMQSTDFNIYSTGRTKRAVFIILPEERQTYHTQAALFVTQEYQRLKQESKLNGNRLARRVNFNLEEFGNFAKIEGIQSMLTVGGGAGIRFNLFLQSFAQLDDVYERDAAQIVRDNCETWIYLLTDNEGTLKELSNKLDTYTIMSPSHSMSDNGSSSSYNLTSRPLLMPGEIKRIGRPWQLITSRNEPAVMYSPDISETIFNKLLGLGDKDFNQEVIMARQNARQERVMTYSDMKILELSDYFPNGIYALEEASNENTGTNVLQGLAKSILRPSSLQEPVPFKKIT